MRLIACQFLMLLVAVLVPLADADEKGLAETRKNPAYPVHDGLTKIILANRTVLRLIEQGASHGFVYERVTRRSNDWATICDVQFKRIGSERPHRAIIPVTVDMAAVGNSIIKGVGSVEYIP